MDIELQPKLLRAVEYGEFLPVGSDKARKSSARMVAAVNEDLAKALQAKSLRVDLFYRLASYIIRVPDLEERPEDIPRLVTHFFEKLCVPAGIQRIEKDAMRKLCAYHWPGNVRELRAAIEAALVNCAHREGTVLSTSDLDIFPSEAASTVSANDSSGTIAQSTNAIYAGDLNLHQAEARLKARLLEEIRDREGGDTARIATVLHMSQSAVRTMFGRAGLALGHSYRRALSDGSANSD